jgi:thiol-disulfide isomerase/thioredoxin
MKNRLLKNFILILILLSRFLSYGQEQHVVELHPVTDVDSYGSLTCPVYEVMFNDEFFHKGKKYKIKLPDTRAMYGITFSHFDGIKGKISPHNITILIKDFKTSNPTFYMDKNDNLDFTDDDPPKQFCDTTIRHHNQNYRFVPFSINNPDNSNKTYNFYLKEISNTTGLNFKRNTIKLSKRENVADVEYWLSIIRFNRVGGELKLGEQKFQLIVHDYYCSTNYRSKGNFIFAVELNRENSDISKWVIREETVIALGDKIFDIKVDRFGTKAILTETKDGVKLPYRKNDKIFNFPVKLLNGGEIMIKDYLNKDKYLLLYFWGTWCAPCKQIQPSLKEFYINNRDQIEIIGIAVNSTKDDVLEYVENYDIPWINSIPSKNDLGSIMTKLNVQGVPSFVLIDQDGIMRSEDTSLYVIENMFK